MADGFTGLFEGLSQILSSFFQMAILGTNMGLLLIAFGVVSMILAFLVRRFLHD